MNNLMKELEKNNLKIKELDKKINLLESNSFKVKGVFVMVFSIIPWVLLVFLDPTLVKFIPLNLIQPLTILIPTLIGIIGEHLFQKKFKIKERLASFSNSKTEKERNIEEITYSIEKEKLINYNKVLNKSNVNSYILDSLPNNYQDKEENIKKLNELLEENKKKIDILSYKTVLKNSFYRIRDNFQTVMDQIGFTFMGGFFFMVLYYLPLLSINNFTNLTIELSVLNVFAPFLVGGLITGSYVYKKRLDEKSIFRFFNRKLGKNALNDKINSKVKEDFDLELEKVIAISSLINMNLEKLKNNNQEDYKVIEAPTYQEDTKEIVREEKAKVKKLGSRHDLH